MIKSFGLKLERWSTVYVPCFWGIGASLYPEPARVFFKQISEGNFSTIPILYWHIFAIIIVSFYLVTRGIKSTHHLEEQAKKIKKENSIIKNDLESLSSIIKHCGGVYLEEIWLIFLNIIYKSNNLTRNERISLYCYNNGQEGHFIMLARCSDNPELRAKGRGVYKAKEGCIWLGWTNGTSCINGLQDYKKNQKEYLSKMCTEGCISKKIVKSLRVKPRSIGSFAINDLSGKGIAVIVLESNTPDRITPDLIATISSSEEINNIRHILTRFGDNLPKMSTLRAKGF